MTRLLLSVLGPLQATLDGQPVTGFESNKVRAMLAFLAVEAHRPHSRDALIGLLWPEQPISPLHCQPYQCVVTNGCIPGG